MWCHSTTTFENFLGNLLKLFVSITLRACKIKREESSNKSWYINAINTSGDCRQSLESPQDFRKSLRIFATATLHYRWLFSYLVREPRITLILAWSTTLSFSIEKQRNKCPVTKKRLEFKNSLRRENDTFWQSVELLYHVRFFRRIIKVLLNFFSFLAFSPCEWSPFRPSSLHLVNYLLPSLLFCFHLRITEIGRVSRTVTKENCQLRLPSIDANLGSMSVSEQLHTYPSPNPTLTLACNNDIYP